MCETRMRNAELLPDMRNADEECGTHEKARNAEYGIWNSECGIRTGVDSGKFLVRSRLESEHIFRSYPGIASKYIFEQ